MYSVPFYCLMPFLIFHFSYRYFFFNFEQVQYFLLSEWQHNCNQKFENYFLTRKKRLIFIRQYIKVIFQGNSQKIEGKKQKNATPCTHHSCNLYKIFKKRVVRLYLFPMLSSNLHFKSPSPFSLTQLPKRINWYSNYVPPTKTNI